MKKNIFSLLWKSMTVLCFVIATLLSARSAHAAAVLEVESITWNVVGLDSNDVAVGPNHFPVGVRIHNTGDVAAINVEATFVWDDGGDLFTGETSADPYINLRPGTRSVKNFASIPAGGFSDVYFEAEITRDSNAYEKIRRYHVDVTADGPITASSPTPRELFVEHLISQSRNSVLDIELDGVSIPPGGTMNLVVGEEYEIIVRGTTATQGYNQLEEFISMPNTIFQVLSVSTLYSANTGLESNPNNKLYGDACGWENDPNSPNYMSCGGGDGKNGGSVDTTYRVKILSVPGPPLVNPEPLTTLVYDFSGSSFHYNADYGVSARYAMIYGPSSVTIDKSFAPVTIAPNATSVMKITVTNPTPETITGIQFSDPFPSGMKVAGTPAVSITGFSAGAFSPALVGNETTISFSGGTLAPGATGTILVNVTADTTAASYTNTTNHLYINTTTDTGNSASATLYVSSAPPAPSSCITKTQMATWTMPTSGQGSGGPPPPYTTQRTGVTATTAYNRGGGSATGTASQTIVASPGGTTNGWQILWNSDTANTPVVSPAPDINTTAILAPYIDLTVQYPVNKYGAVAIDFSIYLNNTGWASPNNNLYIYSRADGGPFGAGTIVTVGKNSWTAVSATTATITGSTSTTFRIFVYGMTQNKASTWLVDNITIAGCEALDPPTVTKSFLTDPIKQDDTSILRFTLTNPNAGSSLSGIAFTDVLPAGLTVEDGSSTTCGAGALTTTAATRTIEVTGASIAPSGSCIIDVTVTGAVAGNYTNVSGNVSATESGTNTTSSGYATDTIQVIAPPTFLKSFSPGSIYVNGTSTLTFEITNPNTTTELTGVAFTDNLPSGLVVATPNGLSGGCGSGTITATAGSGTISLTGAALAGGATCTFSVDVTGTSAGTKNNSTHATSTNGGDSNTSAASLVVVDRTPAIDLTKQISADGEDGPWSKYTGVLPNGSVWYRFKVYNSGDLEFTDLNITDDNFTPSCSWDPALPLLPGDETYCVYGPVTATHASLVNTAHVTGTYDSGTLRSEDSTAEYAGAALTLSKSATETYYAAVGDVLHYSYVVTNSGAASLEGPVTITDDLVPIVNCPDFNTVGDFDNYLEPGESIICTATYTVASGDVGTGKSVTNTAFATVEGVNSNTDSATVAWKYLDLIVTKTNNTGGGCPVGSTFTWTLTISNNGEIGAAFTDTQAIMRDPLPAGATYTNLSTGNFINITNSGNIAPAIDGSNVLTCTADGASVTIGAGGSFTVSFEVTPTATGNLVNTATVDPNDEVGETYETNNTGSNTVIVSTQEPPVISWDPNNSGGGLDDEGFETTFPQGGSAQAVGDVDASVTDSDDTAMSILTLTAGDIADGADEIFTIGGTVFPQNADKTADVTLGGTAFHVVYVAATHTFTITKNGGGDMPIADMNALLRGILYQNTSGTPTYGNRTLSAKTNDGTVDSNTTVARILVAKTATMAVIGEFGAFNDGGKVLVRWQTVSENGTLGFYLYRLNEKTGEYQAVNNKLLPGLLFSSAGGWYSYEDKEAKTAAYYTYRLEEVEVTGNRIEYGPWKVFTGAPLPIMESQVKLDAHTSIPGFRQAEKPLSDKTISRLEAKMSARLGALVAKTARKGRQAKIGISEDGLYFIDAKDIAEVLNININTISKQIQNNHIRLRCMGQPVAVLSADDNSGVYFYGEKHETRYSDENVYWLDIDKGLKMQTVNRAPKKAAGGLQYFTQWVREEEDQYPMTGLFSDPGADFWMWDYVFPGFGRDTVTLTVSSPGVVDAGDAAILRVSLQGGSETYDGKDHHAVIRINGAEVAAAQWDGLSATVVSAPVPAAILNDGENLVEIAGIRVSGVPYNIFYVDDLQLTYPRQYTAFENQLTAENKGYPALCMQGFTDSDIRVFDITDPKIPKVLAGTVIETSDNGNGDFQVRFNTTASDLNRYLAITPEMIKPCTLFADQPSYLKKSSNLGEYLIITSSDMMATAHTLADYRTSRGHVSLVVDIENIYDEFSYGIKDPEAIREFLIYAYTHWQISPKYLLLAGDGSFDYKDNKGFGDSVIPPLIAGTHDGLRVTDFPYSNVAGADLVPEFAIGRIPVISRNELLDYIKKIKGYESSGGAWTTRAILVADAPDRGGDFIKSSEIVADLFPAAYLLDKLYLNVMTLKNARLNFVSDINDGRAYVNFFGHGAMFQIGNHNLFSTNDISKLNNGMRLPVFTAMTCVAGDFGYPGFDGLTEELVLKSDGGAVAMWSPSGYSFNANSTQLCKGFYSAVFIGGEKVLGDAIRRSQETYVTSGVELYHLDLYNLIGDPALELK